MKPYCIENATEMCATAERAGSGEQDIKVTLLKGNRFMDPRSGPFVSSMVERDLP